MYFYACVFNIMNVTAMYIKYIKSANILIVYVARGKYALEISPEMLCVTVQTLFSLNTCPKPKK